MAIQEEIEVKYLDIDKEKIVQRLKSIGATKIGDIFLRHISFDFPDYRLDKDHSWVRLRDEGNKIVIAFKKRLGVSSQDGSKNDKGMEEIEVVVDSFKETREFLKKIGLIEKHGEAQKKRSKWKKNGVCFDIDTIALIPTYLEIEAGSWDEVHEAIRELDLNPEDKKICSANQLLKIYGIDTNDYRTINFDEVVKKSEKK
jgi:adenylate cyclase, class 2